MDENLPTGETMMEGGAIPPMAEPAVAVVEPMAGPGMEDSVPLAALATADESNALETPAVGDRVSYTTDGKIIRIEGDRAFIQKESINGQQLASESGPETPAPDSIEQLSADAGAMDEASPMG